LLPDVTVLQAVVEEETEIVGSTAGANVGTDASNNFYDVGVPSAARGKVVSKDAAAAAAAAAAAGSERAVNHHGDIERTLAERRLKTAGRCRYLLRNKTGSGNGGLVVSYVGTNGKCTHSPITEVGGTFFRDDKPLATATTPPTLSAAIDAALVVVRTRVGKPIFPVRDPAASVQSFNIASGYVNTTYEVMAAAASELPVMDRFEAEQKLIAAKVEDGFILRHNADEDDIVSISCTSKGSFEHYKMSLFEDAKLGSASWVYKTVLLPEVSMIEAAIGLLHDKQIPNPQCINPESVGESSV